MEKTAMQRLIDWSEERDMYLSKEWLSQLLELEKKQIINAFNQGFREGESETMVASKKDVSDFDLISGLFCGIKNNWDEESIFHTAKECERRKLIVTFKGTEIKIGVKQDD